MRFEHTVTFSEAEYAQLKRMTLVSTRHQVIAVLVGAAGVAGLFWNRWSASLGVLLLLASGLLLLTPRITRRGIRDEYRTAAYLRGPITYGVGEEGVWFEGGNLSARSSWEGVRVWHLRDRWLMLSASGMPPVYLPEGRLREADAFDAVMNLARTHAVEYDSPEAKGKGRAPAA